MRTDAPTDTYVAVVRCRGAEKTGACGTGKPVPYIVRRNIVTQPQILHRTHGKRQFSGFVGSFDTGQLQYMYRYSLKAPLKIRL